MLLVVHRPSLIRILLCPLIELLLRLLILVVLLHVLLHLLLAMHLIVRLHWSAEVLHLVELVDRWLLHHCVRT